MGVTWMNAQIGDVPVTPRNGRAVEINVLWYNALRIGADLAKKFHHPVRAEELSTLANRVKQAFNRRFWNEQTGCCFDVVGENGNDPAVRPNQLLAISLAYPVLNVDRHATVLTKVRNDLLTPMGIKSLAGSDANYLGRYGGSILARDRAYHQGCAYPWLLGAFVSAFIRVYGKSQPTREQAMAMLKPCLDHLATQGSSQIHELFDGDAPHHPGGLTASGRSIAEILRAYVEDVLDLTPSDAIRQSTVGAATAAVAQAVL